MPGMFFEDFKVGDVHIFGRHELTQREIVEFATQFDPQPFHIDPEAAKSSIFGGLIASGWHTAAICMRHVVNDLYGHDSGSIGASGMEELRWPLAARPGDVLQFRLEVLTAAVSQRRPDRGRLTLRYSAFNQANQEVVWMVGTVYFLRREVIEA